jgi:ribosomal-protein-alanine N-acetyltransferase
MEQRQKHEPEHSLEFRSMRFDDIPLVCEIEQEAFATPWTEGAFHNELTNNQYAHYMIMDMDGVVAGYGGLWLIIDEAHITNVAVRDIFRGRKLGERLLIELMRTASFLGAERMTLEVRPSNTIAQRLYEKLGFRAVGVRKGYYTDNQEDAIIMWAELTRYRRDSRED